MNKLALAIMLVSCGGSTADTDSESADTTSGSEETDPHSAGVRTRDPSEYPTPPQPWAEMDAAARGQYMAQSIVPYFKELFQEYDAERYADFGCTTCHGNGAVSRGFAMPNPDILALHPTGTPEQQQMAADHPRMVRLMFNHIVPPMKNAIQGEDFNPDTGEGFSCYTCHPSAVPRNAGASASETEPDAAAEAEAQPESETDAAAAPPTE